MKNKYPRDVRVAIMKGGYWTNSRAGVALGETKAGRIRVKTICGVRCYSPRNVTDRKTGAPL